MAIAWASFNTATGTPPNGIGAPFAMTVTSSNGFNPTSTQQFTLGVQGTFSLRQSLYFGANANASPNAAALATPAGDGIPNLIKYALGANPFVPSGEALPVAALTLDPKDSLQHLTLTVALDASATGTTVTARVSSDLVTWQSDAGFTEIASDSMVNGTRTITFRDLTLSGTTAPRRYIRLSVSMP